MHTGSLYRARYSLSFWLMSLLSIGVLESILMPLRAAVNGMSPAAAFLGLGVYTVCLYGQFFGIAFYLISYLLNETWRPVFRLFAWGFVAGLFLLAISWYVMWHVRLS